MTEFIIPPLHVSELSHLQSVALWNAGAIVGRHLVDLDGYVNDDEVADRLRLMAIAAGLDAVQA